jgi:hypothetical protein
MPYAVPNQSELFSDSNSPVEVAQRFEQYKSALAATHARSQAGGLAFAPGEGIVKTAAPNAALAEKVDTLTKALSPETLAGSQAVAGDVNKDWTTSFPNTAGLVPYDLEAPAKLLVPRLTPLRNSTPRGKGQGTARQFKRILGWSNSGTGGVADMSPFMDSQTSTATFGSLSLRRGAKITYASDSKSVIYKEQGLSDSVTWKAQFAGQGYEDIRSLSQTALLWATFGGEERALLFGRGTDTGYAGAVSAPAISASAGGTGATIPAATYSIKVTARAGFGESVPSSAASVAVTLGQALTVNVTTEPNGALGYNVYIGPSGSEVFQTSFVGNQVVLTAYATGTAAVPVADSSANANAYDGFLTVQADPAQSGYVKRINSTLSTTNPGTEFQAAFLSLYQSVKADPDGIWTDAGVMVELGDLLKTSSSSNYRIALTNDGHGASLGSTVVGIENEVTRKMVDLQVHPYMPAGCALIRSLSLPMPDSEVSNTAEVVNVQDYMAIDWPVIQATYDQSTYLYGALVHYAPAWSGLLMGIK